MSRESAAGSAAGRAASGAARVVRAWRALPHERRLAAYAAIGLFLALFLPWYQETVIASGKATHLQSLSASITGWGAFSFVEAAVLLVAAGVLTLLFQRAEARAFHLPGGDGWVITAAGLWTCALIVWRIFDKQGTSVHGPGATSSGVEWGIFVALAIAAFLTYAGSRIRATHQPEPLLPGEAARRPAPAVAADRQAEATAPPDRRPATAVASDRSRGSAVPADRRPDRPPRPVPAEPPRRRRVSWEDPPTWEDHPKRRAGADEPATQPVHPDGPETRHAGADEAPTQPVHPDAQENRPAGAAEPPSQPVDPGASERNDAGAEGAATVRLPKPSTRAARARSETDPEERHTIPLQPDSRKRHS
jgi:hypothetical protein